ncbi:MAG: TolC family protein [Planctomycetota bacterium]|jgi:outer membrane protein TolC
MRKLVPVSLPSFILFLSVVCLIVPAGAQETTSTAEPFAAESPSPAEDAEMGGETAPAVSTLTLAEAIALAMRANLDLRVAGYSPLIFNEEIGRALSEFDPTVGSAFGYSSQRTPSFSTTIPTTSTRRWNLDLGLGTKTLSGASLSVSMMNYETRTNNLFISSESPFYETRISFSLTQPLLRNAGVDVNRTGIVIAQNNLRISVFDFEEQVMDLLLDVSNAYWNLVFFREDMKAREKSLQAAEDFLKNTQIKLDAGAVPEIEVTRARARVADRQQQIVISRAAISEAEDRLRSLLGTDKSLLMSTAPIVPTDVPSVRADNLDLPASVNYALSGRPDIRRQRVVLESYDLLVAQAKNQLLPQVDLEATYALNGLGDTWGDNFHMIGTLDQRDITAGLTFSVPIGNRSARSGYSRTRYERLQALTRYAIVERDITLAVKDAIRAVSTSLQSVETSRVRVQASAEQLEAEKSKYDVGLGISLDVLDAQEALQQAESALILSTVSFTKAMNAYHRQIGRILPRYEITVAPPTAVSRNGDPLFP